MIFFNPFLVFVVEIVSEKLILLRDDLKLSYFFYEGSLQQTSISVWHIIKQLAIGTIGTIALFIFTRVQYLLELFVGDGIFEKHIFNGDTGNFNENGGWLAFI